MLYKKYLFFQQQSGVILFQLRPMIWCLEKEHNVYFVNIYSISVVFNSFIFCFNLSSSFLSSVDNSANILSSFSTFIPNANDFLNIFIKTSNEGRFAGSQKFEKTHRKTLTIAPT